MTAVSLELRLIDRPLDTGSRRNLLRVIFVSFKTRRILSSQSVTDDTLPQKN